jgi:hypothetical protein
MHERIAISTDSITRVPPHGLLGLCPTTHNPVGCNLQTAGDGDGDGAAVFFQDSTDTEEQENQK